MLACEILCLSFVRFLTMFQTPGPIAISMIIEASKNLFDFSLRSCEFFMLFYHVIYETVRKKHLGAPILALSLLLFRYEVQMYMLWLFMLTLMLLWWLMTGLPEDESKLLLHLSPDSQLDVVKWNPLNQNEV